MKTITKKVNCHPDGGWMAVGHGNISNVVGLPNEWDIDLESGFVRWNESINEEERNLEFVELTFDYDDKVGLIAELRSNRNALLAETDQWMLRFLTGELDLTTAEKQAGKDYRQALRDLPQNVNINDINSVDDVSWPTKPTWMK